MTRKEGLGVTPIEKPFELLNYELQEASVEAELCLVGGAVMVVSFNASPDTRRIRALFKPSRLVVAASETVAATLDLPVGWLNESVRRHLEPDGAFLAESNLKVFAARPDYVLALKCASLPYETGPVDRGDIRYLLRFLDIGSVSEALTVIGRYFNERQLPADIDQVLTAILG